MILRTEKHLEEGIMKKVASFCNVDLDCVIQSEDLPSIYEVPVNMQNQGLDTAILRKMGDLSAKSLRWVLGELSSTAETRLQRW